MIFKQSYRSNIMPGNLQIRTKLVPVLGYEVIDLPLSEKTIWKFNIWDN